MTEGTGDILRKAKEQGETPAFPVVSDQFGHFSGMTLRDWFAGQAMVLVSQCAGHQELMLDGRGYTKPEDVAAGLYRIADAMLVARAEGSST